MDFVAVDIGASMTRYTSNDMKVGFISNNMVILNDMSRDSHLESYDSIPENNLDVVIEKDGESAMFPVRALIGDLAQRYSRSTTRPSQQAAKTDQKINYISMITSVALTKLKRSDIGDEINMFIALPPLEAKERKRKVKEVLVGEYTVRFPMIGENTTTVGQGGTVVKFRINNVACYEESRMAIMQFFFDSRHPERQQKYANSTILSIDIGASTTDLVIFRMGKYIDNTGETLKFGCNSAIRDLISKITTEYSVTLQHTDAEKCFTEGRMPFGNSFKDISQIVIESKEAVARDIISNMDEYFGKCGIPMTMINYVIVSGGGSMASGYVDEDGIWVKTSEPMCKYIIDEMHAQCPDIEPLYFGEEPRLANISGLGTLAYVRKGVIKE